MLSFLFSFVVSHIEREFSVSFLFSFLLLLRPILSNRISKSLCSHPMNSFFPLKAKIESASHYSLSMFFLFTLLALSHLSVHFSFSTYSLQFHRTLTALWHWLFAALCSFYFFPTDHPDFALKSLAVLDRSTVIVVFTSLDVSLQRHPWS